MLKISKLVLASGNKKKLTELLQCMSPLGVNVVPQSEFNISDADETGLSFIENAIIKARHASAIAGLPALADDSGLEVDALHGEPGIYSARYAGGAGDSANNSKLLDALEGVPAGDRTARFQCVLAFLRHENDPTPAIFTGTWEGTIRSSLSGGNGFGYDPLFQPAGLSITSAELNAEIKNQLSHRAQAIRKLQNYFLRVNR